MKGEEAFLCPDVDTGTGGMTNETNFKKKKISDSRFLELVRGLIVFLNLDLIVFLNLEGETTNSKAVLEMSTLYAEERHLAAAHVKAMVIQSVERVRASDSPVTMDKIRGRSSPVQTLSAAIGLSIPQAVGAATQKGLSTMNSDRYLIKATLELALDNDFIIMILGWVMFFLVVVIFYLGFRCGSWWSMSPSPGFARSQPSTTRNVGTQSQCTYSAVRGNEKVQFEWLRKGEDGAFPD